MRTFKVMQTACIALGLGYFKMTLHVHIVFRARSSLKGIQTIQMGFFKNVGIAFRFGFHLNLQYLDLYLPLPTRILGFRCNTYTRTYLQQLEFWGTIAILALVLIFTNWDFRAQLQYLHLTLILSLSLCFYIARFLCLILGNDNNLCAILDFMCVLNT